MSKVIFYGSSLVSDDGHFWRAESKDDRIAKIQASVLNTMVSQFNHHDPPLIVLEKLEQEGKLRIVKAPEESTSDDTSIGDT